MEDLFFHYSTILEKTLNENDDQAASFIFMVYITSLHFYLSHIVEQHPATYHSLFISSSLASSVEDLYFVLSIIIKQSLSRSYSFTMLLSVDIAYSELSLPYL